MGKCLSRLERHDNLPKRLYPANAPDNEQPSVYSHPNAMLKPNNAARNTSNYLNKTVSPQETPTPWQPGPDR
ncbi:uncharacterized protein FRV6_05528 [Fusarium oxysporum]|uniref:Uncharacterized protein n=1 Tax=Fusarium oxysporum TaxID=5507 RepID=A0A2H3T6M0_FUSOX|nr:uncharacterized protein FRV6_05528 [Fusarium oxysporum]